MGEVDEPFYAVVVIAATGTVAKDEPEEDSHDNSVDDVDDGDTARLQRCNDIDRNNDNLTFKRTHSFQLYYK